MFFVTLILAQTWMLVFGGGDLIFQGCFHVNQSVPLLAEDVLEAEEGMDHLLPFEFCDRQCWMEGRVLSARDRGGNCFCLESREALLVPALENCADRCEDCKPRGAGGPTLGVWERVAPQLGGLGAWLDAPLVAAHVPVTLEAQISLLGLQPSLAPSASNGSRPDPLGLVTFTWRVGGQTLTSTVPGADAQAHACTSFTFPQAQPYVVEVEAANPLTRLRTSFNVSVVVPRPHGLQILPVSPGPSPSCVPPPYSEGDAAVTAAFLGRPLPLEASVTIGPNVSFLLEAWGSDDQPLWSQSRGPGECQGEDCLVFLQELLFWEAGACTVLVRATNTYGQTEANITVVVMEDELEVVNFTLATTSGASAADNSSADPLEKSAGAVMNESGGIVPERSGGAVAVDQLLTFLVAVETTARDATFLEVDFDNGDTRVVSLREELPPAESVTASTTSTPASTTAPLQPWLLHERTMEELQGSYHAEHLSPHLSVLEGGGGRSTLGVGEGGGILEELGVLGGQGPEVGLEIAEGLGGAEILGIVEGLGDKRGSRSGRGLDPIQAGVERGDRESQGEEGRPGNIVNLGRGELTENRRAVDGINPATMSRGGIVEGFGGGGGRGVGEGLAQGMRENWLEGLGLVASYGEGCTLQIRFYYRYAVPGTYRPRLRAFHNLSTDWQSLTQALSVQVVLVEPRLQLPIAVAVEHPVLLHLSLLTPAESVQVEWRVGTTDGQHQRNATTAGTTLEHRFPAPGVYHLVARACNGLGCVSTGGSLLAQRPVADLQLLCDPPHFALLGQVLHCLAEVGVGTEVAFVWRLGGCRQTEAVWNSGPASHIALACPTPGLQTLAVTAHNNVSAVSTSTSITAQAPIKHVLVRSSSPSLLGSATQFEVQAVGGTDVQFDLDFGQGPVRQRVGSQRVGGHLKVEHRFSRRGLHNVTVRAHNAISNASRRLHCLVQPPLSGLQLQVLHPPTPSAPAILTVTEKGAVTQRRDVIYTWRLGGNSSRQSTSPLLAVRSPALRSSQRLNVTVSARNEVDEKTMSVTLEEVEETPRLVHPVSVTLHQPVRFALKAGRDVNGVTIKFGDGHVKQFRRRRRWKHAYDRPGLYVLELTIYGHGARRHLRSLLLVQAPIRALRLSGPRVLEIDSDGDGGGGGVWRAMLESGSHVVYTWTLGSHSVSSKGSPTTLSLWEHTLSEPGSYRLSVSAANDVSRATASLRVVAQRPLLGLELSAAPAVRGRPAALALTVLGERHFASRWEFGDGASTTLTSRASATVAEVRPRTPSSPAAHRVLVQHVYRRVGPVNVTVEVWNRVSRLRTGRLLLVEEAISGLRLSSPSPRLLALGGQATVHAQVDSGRQLSFQWQFQAFPSQTLVTSEGNTSTAVHVFNDPGQYCVSVRVTSPWEPSGVNATLAPCFLVVEEIGGLALQHAIPTLQHAIPPYHRPNTAPLLLVSATPPNTATPNVTFLANTTSGSDIVFQFDFDDGSDPVVVQGHPLPPRPPTYSTMTRAYVSHQYTRVGAYLVSVMARNALGNVTVALAEPFLVQVPVRTVRINGSGSHCVRYGELSQFAATLSSLGPPTNLSLDWHMGDQTELLDAGLTVSHKYRRLGHLLMRVRAHNNVSEAEDIDDVYIVGEIQGVQLSVGQQSPVPAGTLVSLAARTMPDSEGLQAVYNWTWGTSYKTTQSPNTTVHFKLSGNYSIMVRVSNCRSAVVSQPVSVLVVAPIRGLELAPEGDYLVGQPLTFRVKLWQGDHITFHWDFGDGSPPLSTPKRHVTHTYNKQGEYQVQLLASNPFSNVTDSLTVFILWHVCKPPRVSLVNRSGYKFLRSELLVIESTVEVNCTVTPGVRYHWTVVDMDTSRPVPLNCSQWHCTDYQQVLVLPPQSLPYGNYRVHLEVRMNQTLNGTKVYARRQTEVSIQPTSLHSFIQGGALRPASRYGQILLDGSQSFDPDEEEGSPLRYEWSCMLLMEPNLSCFKESWHWKLLETNRSVLQFNASLLRDDVNTFLFNLTVSLPNRMPGLANQVIAVEDAGPDHVLDVGVQCQQCEDQQVNSDSDVRLEALCPDCAVEGTDFRWQIFLVLGEGSQFETAPEPSDPSSCLANDGSGYLALVSNRSRTNGATTSTTSTSTSTTTTTTPTTTTSTTSTASTTQGGGSVLMATAPFSMYQNVQEQPGQGRGKSSRRLGSMSWRRGGRRGQVLSPVPGENDVEEDLGGEGYPLGLDLAMELSEGLPGESGSSFGREWGLYGSPRENSASSNRPLQPRFPLDVREGLPGDTGGSQGRHYGRRVEQRGQEERGEGGDCDQLCVHIRQQVQRTSPRLVLGRERVQLHLPPELTSTQGMQRPALVIRPGFLRQGHTYVVQVVASTPGVGAQGRAMAFFRVNRSPHSGQCSGRPHSGLEGATPFSVFCKEWKDQDEPLQYEVRFQLEEGGPRYLLYRGLSHHSSFPLPAGLAQLDHRVLLSTAVLDRRGAPTSACLVPLRVLPRPPSTSPSASASAAAAPALSHVRARHPVSSPAAASSAGRPSLEETLDAELTRAISVARNHGDARNACLSANYVALQLNRAPLRPTAQPLGTPRDPHRQRCQIREKLLRLLQRLPARDEVEVLQIAQTLLSVTGTVSELQETALCRGGSLLGSLVKKSQTLYGRQRRALGNAGLEELLSLVVASTSSLLHVASVTELQTALKDCPSIAALDALSTLLKMQLARRAVGEEPVQHAADFVSVLGTLHHAADSGSLHLGSARFHLPHSITLPPGLSPSPSGCLQVLMMAFQGDPFSNCVQPPARTAHMQSPVLALELVPCHSNVSLTDFPSDPVTIEIPHSPSQVPQWQSYELRRSWLSVHQFNVSAENLQHAMHLHVDLQPQPSGRLFPIALILSHGAPPRLEGHLLRQEFPAGQDSIHLHFPPASFNASGTYYMGLADATYNAGRRRPGEVTRRTYRLQLWWAQCLHWNTSHGHWSSQGCTTSPSSTLTATHCRCRHLSALRAYFQPVACELILVDIEDLFQPLENFLAVVLLGLVYVVYALLAAMCHRQDQHNARKAGAIHLPDNRPTDSQKYELTLETGFRRGAGTTSKISVILHGEEGMSETRELISNDNRPLFERNSRDKFIVTTGDSLGRIWKVQLWHNNSGLSPSWYLSRVLVKDLNAGLVYVFLCERWLAVEEKDGKVEQEFLVLDGDISFSKVLWVKGSQYMADFHLWLSLLACPSYSRFSLLQRLTVCLALISAYSCLAAVWYHFTYVEYRGEFGLLDLSWQSLAVGMACCAATMPVYGLLLFLFRRSKVHPPGWVSGRREGVGEGGQEEDRPGTAYSLLDQSILNWQGIQDWAQRLWAKRQGLSPSPSASTPATPTSTKSPTPATMATQPVRMPQPPPMLTMLTSLQREEDDQASSGFEDSSSQATAERNRLRLDTAVGSSLLHPHMLLTPHPPSPSASSSTASSTTSSSGTTSGVREQRCFLPRGFRALAWLLTVATVLGCSAVTLYLTFRFSWTKWSLWWQSVYFSLVVCIFLSHPLMVLIAVMYVALRGRRDPSVLCYQDDGFCGEQKDSDAWYRKSREVPECCEECAELERGVAARQRSRYLRFARPPLEKQLMEARKKIQKEKNAVQQFRDGITLGFLFLLLCVIAFSEDTTSSYQLNSNFNQLFSQQGPVQFAGIRTAAEWYQWSQTSLLQAVYGHGQRSASSHQVEFVERGASYLIGPVQLRQLRVSPAPCQTLPFLAHSQNCRHSYSAARQQSGSFGQGQAWRHYQRVEGAMVWGRHAFYDTSGHVLYLNRSREGARRQLAQLAAQGWIDLESRAILVEMTLYNAPTNLFSAVTLLLELPPEGRPSAKVSVDSVCLFRYNSPLDHWVLAAQLLLVGAMLWRVWVELGRLVSLRAAYFRHLWNWVECMTCLVALLYAGALVYRFALVAWAVEKLRSSYYSGYVSVALLALWQQCLQCLLGVLLCLVMLHSMRLLRHNRPFLQLMAALHRAQQELLALTAGYGCMLMALTSLGVGLFVSSSASFSSLWQGLLTVCSLLTGNTSLAPDRTEGGLPAELFLMTVAVFGTGLLTCWVVAVLTRRLRLLRRGRPMESQTLGLGELASHLWSSLLFSLHVQRANTTEERDQYMPPEFILAEMVYQVDELLFRMNALCGSSGLPDKPIHYLTDSDATQGPGGDDGISSGGSEEQVAGLGGCGRDSERLEQRVQKIEDKLYANEPYLAQLLKLDSIGADVLSQEREKQLRSHLELEIFRQLQMQRQECPAPGCRAEAPGGGQQAGGKMADCQDFPDLDRGGDQGGENVGLVASALQHLPPTFGPPSLPSGHSMVCTEGSLPSSHSLTETTSSGAQPSGAPPHTAPSPPPSPPSLPTAWLAKPWSASSDTGSSEGERGGKFSTAAATEGKEECQFPHSSSERRQAPSLAPDKPMAAAALEMKNGSGTPPEGRPSKCSPAESRLRPLRGAWQQVAGGEGAVPRSRPSGPLRVGPEQLLPHGEGAVGWLGVESSSGSEQDSSQGGRRSYGRRNLRKTKSRGKGKGEGDLAPPLLLTHLQEWEGGGRGEGLIHLDHSPPPPTRSAPAPDVSPEHSF